MGDEMRADYRIKIAIYVHVEKSDCKRLPVNFIQGKYDLHEPLWNVSQFERLTQWAAQPLNFYSRSPHIGVIEYLIHAYGGREAVSFC